ncbi:MAG: phenylacetic acid degradation operon negative regulatory protein PaaX [Proteobacteria bacterium]|nr:phenylacetic acid degradation operon negative regulatory protein PaaX [Pseudomonadota bacterium]
MTPAPATPPAPVAALLRHFLAQRPLRAGSLLITLFGDCIAPRGGAVTLGSLIRLARPFGVTERLVRTSVARLAREDWLTARREGRRAEYRLSAGGAARFEEATARIYGPVPGSWDGRWTLLLFPHAVPGARLRAALHWGGFGPLQRGLFAHPSMNADQARRFLDRLDPAPGAVLVLTATAATPVAGQLLAHGWNLRELGAAYGRFVKRFAAVEAVVADGLPAEAAFIVRTLLIHEYRKVHLQDPLLPPALLPAGWIGTQAYELCARLYGRLFRLAEAHLDAVAHRLDRPLPPASAAARGRFGARP